MYRHCEQCGYPLLTHKNRQDPCTVKVDTESLASIEPHEYRALADAEFPHLVNAQCSCGWRAAGYVRKWLAPSFHGQHVTAVKREAQRAG
jgi:hypothetical protein